MRLAQLNPPGYVTPQIRDQAPELQYSETMSAEEEPLKRFGRAIREAREAFGWTQEDLAAEAGVSRPTINRYEQGKVKYPNPEQSRKIFDALRQDPRQIPILLGYLTAEEMRMPAPDPRTFEPSIEEVIDVLTDPHLDRTVRDEWIAYLKFRSQSEPRKPERPRQAG